MAAEVTLDVKVVAALPWVWEHQCGAINKGAYKAGAFCAGCRQDTREEQIQRFLLITTEGSDDQ